MQKEFFDDQYKKIRDIAPGICDTETLIALSGLVVQVRALVSTIQWFAAEYGSAAETGKKLRAIADGLRMKTGTANTRQRTQCLRALFELSGTINDRHIEDAALDTAYGVWDAVCSGAAAAEISETDLCDLLCCCYYLTGEEELKAYVRDTIGKWCGELSPEGKWDALASDRALERLYVMDAYHSATLDDRYESLTRNGTEYYLACGETLPGDMAGRIRHTALAMPLLGLVGNPEQRYSLAEKFGMVTENDLKHYLSSGGKTETQTFLTGMSVLAGCLFYQTDREYMKKESAGHL